MTVRRTREEYVAAAVAALLESGGGLGVSMSMDDVAERAGVSRSTMYRWWPTVADVETDVMVHRATAADSWDQRFLQQSPEGGIGPAVQVALVGHPTDAAVWARSWVASWPDSPHRRMVARHDLDWIARCTAWLQAAYPDERGRPWIDLALVLRAVVEGSVLFLSNLRPLLGEPWTDDEAAGVGNPTERVLGHLIRATSGASEPLDLPELAPVIGPGEPEPKRRTVEFLSGLIFDPEVAAVTDLDPARVVDLEALARRLDVSSRRLFQLWPTPTDLHQDVIQEIIRMQRELNDRSVLELMTAATDVGPEREDVFVPFFEKVLDAALEGTRIRFKATWILADPAVREVAAAKFREWIAVQRVMLFALQQSAHRHVKGGAASDEFVNSAFAISLGGCRLEVMNPGLFARRITLNSLPAQPFAAGQDALFASYTEPCHHSPLPHDDRHQ